MDFVHDQLSTGHPLRVLTIDGIFSWFSPALLPGFNFRGAHVVEALEKVCQEVGVPETIRVDQGSEFISRDLDLWAYQRGVTLDFSRPRKPTDKPKADRPAARRQGAACLVRRPWRCHTPRTPPAETCSPSAAAPARRAPHRGRGATAGRTFELSDEQTRLLELAGVPGAPHRGLHRSLVAVDTFFVGSLKGVGKVYLTAIDCHSRFAWARLYTSKLPVTAVHLMNNDALPTYEAHGAKIETVLSDNGREFCGRPDQHP